MMKTSFGNNLPGWVPEGADRYLQHTEAGRSIRDLARGAGCHPSTVLRQIRKVENRRDDPLVDAALRRLAVAHFREKVQGRPPLEEDVDADAAKAVPVLRRLCDSGAVLAVAEGMEKAVVVRGDGQADKLVVDRSLAQVMALKDWIACDQPGKLSRYYITPTGRAAYGQLLADGENRARHMAEGFSEAQAPFQARGSDAPRPMRRSRYSLGDSPVLTLSRRKDRDGAPFLALDLVRAGERLREDFELAQIGDQVTQNWDHFLTAGCGQRTRNSTGSGASAARERVKQALKALGPGLSDVAMRCCCHLEGLEAAEQKMGWSARSGKIVLRIALQQLQAHYSAHSDADAMIG